MIVPAREYTFQYSVTKVDDTSTHPELVKRKATISWIVLSILEGGLVCLIICVLWTVISSREEYFENMIWIPAYNCWLLCVTAHSNYEYFEQHDTGTEISRFNLIS